MSDPDLHSRARSVFLTACEKRGDERRRFLDSACADDPELRREVETLLGFHTGGPPEDGPAQSDRGERFETGQTIAGRYRIVAHLGTGGMGEVYRVDDLTLGTQVALKAVRRLGSQRARESLIQEVRLAREVTHPAVCRVHDLVEWEDDLLVSMEYVEGEDLGMLIRRVGRLPPERVLPIARQLASGLAAAHAKRVLHRDLKPANVLLNADGNVRIADFGIASSLSDGSTPVAAGTPDYMAPELFAPGAEASEQSDLYALGLVLYEAATGSSPYEGGPRRRRGRPRPPRELVPDLNPALETAILRCLEPDRRDRPESALVLASLLPGSDPLELAAEIGVTPSPRVVAAAPTGPIGRLRPSVLWISLVVLTVAMVAFADRTSNLEGAGVAIAPAALADRAWAMAEDLGHMEAAGAPEYGFVDHPNPGDDEQSVLFWYRRPLRRWVPEATRRLLHARPRILDPPPALGRLIVLLDQKARLVYFEADPTAPPAGAIVREPDWEAALEHAVLDPSTLEAVEAREIAVRSDIARGWERVESTGETEFVLAAGLHGRMVYFSVGAPEADASLVERRRSRDDRAALAGALAIALLVVGLVLAYRNLRKERADRQGARRLVIAMLVALGVSFLLTGPMPAHPLDESSDLILGFLTRALLHGPWLWAGYLAVEPFVRRVWPGTLIAWSRLMAGDLRDPAVGRSLLLGLTAGCALALIGFAGELTLSSWGHELPGSGLAQRLATAMSARRMLGVALLGVPLIVYNGVVALVLLVLLKWVLRGANMAAFAFFALWGLLGAVVSGSSLGPALLLLGLPSAAIATVLLVRFGLLAFVVAWYTSNLSRLYPITLSSELWFAPATLFLVTLIAAVAALAAWAIRSERRAMTLVL